jgi:hypothetical protein
MLLESGTVATTIGFATEVVVCDGYPRVSWVDEGTAVTVTGPVAIPSAVAEVDKIV